MVPRYCRFRRVQKDTIIVGPWSTHVASSTCYLTRCHLTSDAEETWKLKGTVQAKKIPEENGAGNAVSLIGATFRTLI